MSKKVAISPCIRLLLLLSGIAAFAKTTASIIGTVSDPSGAAVVGASISVKNTSQGIERTGTTGSTGGYEIPALPPGVYNVVVTMKGFQSQQAKDLVLAVSQNSVQNFNLKVASSAEVVTVEATAPLVRSEEHTSELQSPDHL